jgi:[ribosomal protein S5]-alanine N-acetyltransferase
VIDIETDRLVLRLVPLAALASTAAEMVETTRSLIGDKLPLQWFAESWVYKTRYDQWIADPSFAPWSIRAVVLKATGEIVGNMNCHHKPMPFMRDGVTTLAVEMGYTIFTPWQRQGVAFEAIHGFIRWAKAEGLESIILSIQPSNVASNALAKKLGAIHIGSQMDERDGHEDIFIFPI